MKLGWLDRQPWLLALEDLVEGGTLEQGPEG